MQNRLEELGVYMVTPAEPAVAAPAADAPPVAEGRPEDLPGIDYDRPGDVKRKQPSGDDDHNPYPYSKEEDDDYFREIFRKKREAKDQGMAEGEGEYPPMPDRYYGDAKEPMGSDDNYDDDEMAEGDNMSTFEEAQCNQTMEGEYCPEHGLEECGNYSMYESELARIKSLALLK